MKEAVNRLDKVLNQPLDRRKRSFFIEKPISGRRFVITDIHGCFQTFLKLLDKISFRTEDQLFILGDMVDRGPYSYLVLEKIAQLIGDGFAIFPLRGNHEQLFLNFNRENPRKLKTFAGRQFSRHLLNESGHLPEEIDLFFSRLPYYYETDIAYLVHAGFNTRKSDHFEEWKDMIWMRNFEYEKKKFKKKMVIHGHVPIPFDEISAAVDAGKRNINLDNGCIRADITGYGRLVCLNMDTDEIISQKNKDLELF